VAHGAITKRNREKDRYLKDPFEQNSADFLRFVFPNAYQRFDLSKEIEFLDKEFFPPVPERFDGAGNRVADLLAKAHFLCCKSVG